MLHQRLFSRWTSSHTAVRKRGGGLGCAILVLGMVGILRGQEDGIEVTTLFPGSSATDAPIAKPVDGLSVGEIRIKPALVSADVLPLRRGDILSSAAISASLKAIRDRIQNDKIAQGLLASSGRITVLYIDVDYVTDSARTSVDVEFRPFYLTVPLLQQGGGWPSLIGSRVAFKSQRINDAVRWLNPSVLIRQDDAIGMAVAVATQAAVESGRLGFPSGQSLVFSGAFEESLDEPFRETDLRLSWRMGGRSEKVMRWNVDIEHRDLKEPFADRVRDGDWSSIRAGSTVRLATHTRLMWEINAGTSSEKRAGAGSTNEEFGRSDHRGARLGFERLVSHGSLGLLRAAVWIDDVKSVRGPAHQLLAGRVGYLHEFVVAPNQTIGVEALVGGGRASSDAPALHRFHGGSEGANFLYDDWLDSALRFPASGPVIRSFGAQQAGIRSDSGMRLSGDRFWHANLNVSFPIPFLSRPIIPDETTDLLDSENAPLKLRTLVKRQINISGQNMLEQYFVTQGLTSEEARRRAGLVLDEVRPASAFLIDEANLFAVKPMLMLDYAQLTDRVQNGRGSWFAVGGGLQLTVVTARLELAYFRTLSGETFGDDDNVVARLVFRTLF